MKLFISRKKNFQNKISHLYHNLKILTEGPCKIYNLKSYPIKIKQMTENNTNILLMKAENKNY